MRIKSIFCLILLANLTIYVQAEEPDYKTIYMPEGGNDMSLSELQSANIKMLIRVPFEKNFMDAARAVDIKIMPYIDLGKAVKSSNDPTLLRNPFWKAVDADSNKHPEWFCITPEGKIKRPFEDIKYHPGFDQACNNNDSLLKAQLDGIDKFIKLGCGGFFIDNTSPRYECYAEDFGLHKHLDSNKSNKEFFETAIREAYKKIKSADGNLQCMINSGFIPEQKGRCDSCMAESLLFSWVHSLDKKNEMNRKYWRTQFLYWQNFKNDKANFALLQNGDASRFSFSYLMDPPSDDEAAFFSFAYTKLLGMNMWAVSPYRWEEDFAEFLARRDIFRMLYRIHNLGKPLSDVTLTNDYAYQSFENAIVAINASDKKISLDVPVSECYMPPVDLLSGEELKVTKGCVRLEMPFQSGRIIVSKRRALENYLTESLAEATAIHDYIEAELKVGNKEFFDSGIPDVMKKISTQIRNNLDKLKAGKDVSIRDLNELSMLVPDISVDKIMKENSERILSDAAKLDANKIKSRLMLSGDEPVVEVFRGGADEKALKPVIRSAKSAVIPFHYWPSTFLNIGEDEYFNLTTGPIPPMGPSGEVFVNWRTKKTATLLIKALPDMGISDSYAVPISFEELDEISSNGTLKQYSAVCKLVGQKTQTEIKNYKLKMNFSVQKGLPFLNMEFELIDAKHNPVKNADFSLTFSSVKGYINAKENSGISTKQQKSSWAYFVSNINDKMGIVVLGEPELQLFSNGIKSRNALKCAVAILSPREYYFLAERLRNLKLYTCKAEALANNIYLNLNAPENFSLYGKNHASISIRNESENEIKSVTYQMDGAATSKRMDKLVELTLKADGTNPGNYSFEIPAGFSENDFAFLSATARINFEDGRKLALYKFMSGRIKEPLEIGDFNIFEQQGTTIKSDVVLNSVIPCSGRAELTLSGDGISIIKNAVDFAIAPDKKQELIFDMATSEKMMNKKVDGILAFQVKNMQKQEIPVSVKFSPSTIIPYKKESPAMDGKLDDKVWQELPVAAKDFLLPGTGEPAKEQTTVKVCHTDKALYIGFCCYSKNINTLVETALPDKNGYSMAALRDDSVEVYLRPCPKEKGNLYMRLGGNCKGIKRNDSFIDVTLINTGVYSETEKHTWSLKTSRYSDRWEAELEIPFNVIGYNPAKGGSWGINFCRNNPHGDRGSSWSCTYGAFAQPNFFGWGRFE